MTLIIAFILMTLAFFCGPEHYISAGFMATLAAALLVADSQ